MRVASGNGVVAGQLPPQQNAAISLPASLFGMISDDRDNVSLFFALYDTPILFPVNGGNSRSSDGSVQTEVGSSVLAATVGPDINFQNLTDPIIIVLRLLTTASEGRVSYYFNLNKLSTKGQFRVVASTHIMECKGSVHTALF